MKRQPQGEKTVFIANLPREKKSAIENNAHKTPTWISQHIFKDFFYKTKQHLEFLSIKEAAQSRLSLYLSKYILCKKLICSTHW